MALAAGAALAAPASAHAAAPGLRYAIEVRLDPLRHRLTGTETVTYRSGADTALPAIHFHAYPNAFSGPHTVFGREAERVGEDYGLRFAPAARRGWMTIDSASVDGTPAAVVVEETLARVDLPRPLPPGDSVAITLRFTVQVPSPFSRLGRAGTAYALGQWYPKVCVYDDRGWHLDPYHYVAEFYGDFGTYDVAITLPDRYWVGATGRAVGVEGGDNEIPLWPAKAPVDSATVSIGVVLADSLAGPVPRSLTIETDLEAAAGGPLPPITVTREGRAELRVPRGAPVHYAYRWADRDGGEGEPRGSDESGGPGREEADSERRPGPLRLVIAARDTALTDTLRALAPRAAPADSVLPSMKTVRFRAERVHDFAWVASPEYVRDDTTWSGIEIRSLTFRGEPDAWRESNRMVVRAMEFLTRRVGPYPHPAFTSAQAWIGGGAMEYPMLIMNEPAILSPWWEELDVTIAHEVAHSWFYGALASDEREHPWLDEGFSHYMQQWYADTQYPRGLLRLRDRFPFSRLRPLRAFDEDEQTYLRRAWSRGELPAAAPAEAHRGYPSYGTAAYVKPALMLHSLRGLLGDSVFVAFLRHYYDRHAFTHPRPADVVRAAETASGRDLKEFFRAWIGGTDRAGFAIAGVRRGRTGAGHRAAVRIRRTEAMVLPLAVEARFADGTVQEKRVTPQERVTEVVFESGARLTAATLDPHHEIAETNRLDNRTGRLPPIRLRPLYDLPTSEALTIGVGPTVWAGRQEGLRYGAWASGRYLASPDFPSGIRGVEGALSGGSRDRSLAWRVGASRRAGLLGSRGHLALRAVRDAGLLRAGASTGNVVTAPGRRHPFRSWTLEAAYRDRFDMAPVDGRYWSPGRSLDLRLGLDLATLGPGRREHVALELRHGFATPRRDVGDPPDRPYRRVVLTASQSLRLRPAGPVDVTWRIFAASAGGEVPRELNFDVAEGSRLDAIGRFFLNDRGPIVSSGRYLHPGGGGLRGYHDRAVLGTRVWSAGLEVGLPKLPSVTCFAGAGRVERGRASQVGETLADAGLAFDIPYLRLTMPVWVGSPRVDESPWGLRWMLTVTDVPRLP